MVEARSQPGWRAVVVVAAAVVAVVAGAAVLTRLLPAPIHDAIVDGPVLIVVLIAGTAFVLWRISRGRPATTDHTPDGKGRP